YSRQRHLHSFPHDALPICEALQLLLAAESLADAGEVVLTDAVYLSMTKSEAATEIVAERELPGGGRIRLRRALRGPDPRAPYGRSEEHTSVLQSREKPACR